MLKPLKGHLDYLATLTFPTFPKESLSREELEKKYSKYDTILPKEDVCKDWKSVDLDSTVLDNMISGVTDRIKQHNKLVEEVIEEYMLFKYNVTVEQVKKVSGNTNNFKLKNFHMVGNTNCTDYFDKDFCFMTVNRGLDGSSIVKHFRWG